MKRLGEYLLAALFLSIGVLSGAAGVASIWDFGTDWLMCLAGIGLIMGAVYIFALVYFGFWAKEQ